MSAVVTLIGRRGDLADDVIAAAGAALAGAGLETAPAAWLSPGEAADLVVTAGEPQRTAAIIAPLASVLAIDMAVQNPRHRRKRLLVADMDSTIIGQECIDELAAAVGKRDTVSAITERAMRGEIDFDGALRERAAMIAGLTTADLEAVFESRITLNPGARTLIATMRRSGAMTALVSGGFAFFTARVRALAGFDVDQANDLLVDDGGKLTGKVREPILGRDAKREALDRLARQHEIALSETMAVGDGANDLAMIQAAGLGVAYRAKPTVAAQADVSIRYADLSALLFIQGYRRVDFVDAD